MVRGKKNPEQQIAAYILYSKGEKLSPIHLTLKSKFKETAPSLRSVAGWIAEFKLLPDNLAKEDKNFEWHKSQEYPIPWEASQTITQLIDKKSPISVRSVKWLWRVSQSNKNLTSQEIIKIAENYSKREIICLLNNKNIDFSDLNSELGYFNSHTVDKKTLIFKKLCRNNNEIKSNNLWDEK